MIRERNAIAGFLVLLLGMMAFYCLGLLLGRTQAEMALPANPPSQAAGKSKSPARDPRSELDFINAPANNESDANRVRSQGRDSPPGRLYENGAPLEGKENRSREFFSVQVGVFEKEQDARQVADELIRQGYSARTVPPPVGGSDSKFRVYIGRFAGRNEAESLARQLGKVGFAVRVKSLTGNSER